MKLIQFQLQEYDLPRANHIPEVERVNYIVVSTIFVERQCISLDRILAQKLSNHIQSYIKKTVKSNE